MSPAANTTPPPPDSVADAVRRNWVDTWAPDWARPYLRLSRADRPIGTWLLLLPGWWAIALAGPRWLPDLGLMILFGLGAWLMRGAGCTFNDIVDRDFDALVARTRSRPIPAGQVSVKSAWAWLIVQALLGFLILLQMNGLAIGLGIASLALIAIYPFMKRLTWWPQAFLGLTFNWGALLGWTAVTGRLGGTAIVLYLAGIAWTLGYDTIYAHQDKEDDALIGVKSTARLFGDSTWLWLYGFYALTITGLLLAGRLTGLGLLFYIGIIVAAAHLLWQAATLDTGNPADCLTKFRGNRDFGLIVLAAIILGHLL